MIKDLFVDGLVQIAIVLSLLRTDIDVDLGGRHRDVQSGDLQDIFLGTSAAIIQTDLYQNRWRSDQGLPVHPKHIENYFPSNLLDELCSLNSGNFLPSSSLIEAYLVCDSSLSGNEQHDGDRDNEAHENSDSVINNEQTPDTNRPGSELTREEMDLIDILWKQDMDMGVGREAFDGKLRKELEKTNATSPCKMEEDEGCYCPDGDSTDCLQEMVFAKDNETGEMVPSVRVSDFSELNLQSDQMNGQPNQQDTLFEDAISIMQDVAAERQPETDSSDSVEEEFRTMLESSSQDLSLSRQASLENRWMDIETFISGNVNQSQDGVTTPTSLLGFLQRDEGEFESPLRALLSNATLSATPEIPENLTSVSEFPQLSCSFNDSEPSSALGNQWTEGLFPNVTLANISSETDELLQEVLQGDVENIHLVPLNGSVVDKDILGDDGADSAFGSISSSSPRDGWLASHFDGIEGATGGESDDSKQFNYVQLADGSYIPIKYEYASSNTSFNSSGSEHSASGYTSTPASIHDVAHNHSYTDLKPEETSQKKKPLKPPTTTKKTPAQPLTRDEKKLQSMNVKYSISQIVESPVEEFNEMLTRYKFNSAQLQLIKDIRRRGKNKVAAQNCRKRKIEVIQTLEEEVASLSRQRGLLREEQEHLAREQQSMQNKYQELYEQVLSSMNDENGRPYSTDYQLEHMPNGSVFLVPKGSMSSSNPHQKDDGKSRDDEDNSKDSKKRKSYK